MSDLDKEYRNERVVRATTLLNQGVKPKRSPAVYPCYNCGNGTRRHVFDEAATSHSGIIPICPDCERVLTNTSNPAKNKRQPKLPKPPKAEKPFIFRNPQPVQIIFVEYECWKCKKPGHIYYVNCDYVSEDGELLEENKTPAPNESPFTNPFRPEIIKVAQDFCASPEGEHIRLGEIKLRRSKTLGETYNSFGCYSCDALFGDTPVKVHILTEWLVLDKEQQKQEAAAVLPTTVTFEKSS